MMLPQSRQFPASPRQRTTAIKGTALRLITAILIVATAGCDSRGGEENSAAQNPAEIRAVPLVPVVSRVFTRTLSLPGDLVAFQDVALHARVQGFVEAIDVDRGSVVKSGTILARIVAPELQADLGEAEAREQTAAAQLLEARAALASERATFEGLRQAAATRGVVAENDVEVARQRVEAAAARVEAATQNVEAMGQMARAAREIEAYLQVTAPFDGVVTERNVHTGTMVNPGDTPIVRIQQISTLRLVLAIPEAYATGIEADQAIEFSVATFPGETFTGTIARIAQALDPGTRTMAVELDVDNAAQRLAPGMFADVSWPVRRVSPTLFVPMSAVAVTTERSFVVRVREGVAEWVDVRRGATMNDLVEVFGDLSAGDPVAIRGTDELRAGARVRPAETPGQ